ncbi:MAG TPA: hypothetical protein VEU30_07915 [Thermoanaerobaculia bacterium]|nr:hypothetical protein [Thermoanaerobaculia bacterium]
MPIIKSTDTFENKEPKPVVRHPLSAKRPNGPDILFPDEPTSIPYEEIERAVDAVKAARKKKQSPS